MIKLITDGSLPHPAKCVSCGYSGQERFYFWFKYKEKWGQVLICTTCMTEAAMLDGTDFVPMGSMDALLEETTKLRAERERLAGILDGFREQFDHLVDTLVTGIANLNEEPKSESLVEVEVGPVESVVGPDVEPDEPVSIIEGDSESGDDGTTFNAEHYEPESTEFPELADDPFGKF